MKPHGQFSCSLVAAACSALPVNAFVALPEVRSKHRSHPPLSSTVESAEVDANDSLESTATTPKAATEPRQKKIALLLCPAQFCVPADYAALLSSISASPHLPPNTSVAASAVAPLPRTEWIKVAKQLPTKNFLDATLDVETTLDWYFDAIEEGLGELFARAEEDAEVCIVGHSIGGWVARAYLGGLSGSSTAVHRLAGERITSLVTLGTPHISPPEAPVDQTRGLLRQIASSPSCSSQSLAERGVRITCVGGSGLKGDLFAADAERIVAAASYLPLVGRCDAGGDGIVPASLAFMESPARRVEVRSCAVTGGPVRHAHVLPTPWNLWSGYEASWNLPEEFVWYGSEGVLSQWLPFL